MEWVETTAKTVEEAVAIALEQLGVGAQEAEVEIVEEPKSGLFGRVRSDARVRVRIRPVLHQSKEGRQRKPKAVRGSSEDPAPATPNEALGAGAKPRRSVRAPKVDKAAKGDKTEKVDKAPKAEKPEKGPRAAKPAPTRRTEDDGAGVDGFAVPEEVDQVGKEFLTGLIEAMGLQGSVESSMVNANMIEFRIEGRDLGVLIGPRAQTFQAVQELLRTVIHYETESHSGRVLLDVAGYREKRRVALTAFTAKVAAEVLASGERRALEPMSPADRKVVHDAINDIDGVSSTSEGEDPTRFVVILPE